jgi:hypothetical protein
VATLIANNESRPHFLVELFRELQMLTTDYLRQRALYNLQDLVTRFLTEDGVSREAKAATATANVVHTCSVCVCVYVLELVSDRIIFFSFTCVKPCTCSYKYYVRIYSVLELVGLLLHVHVDIRVVPASKRKKHRCLYLNLMQSRFLSSFNNYSITNTVSGVDYWVRL